MRLSCLQSPLRTISLAAVLYLLAPASAQAQSPYLYASVPNGTTSLIAGYSVAPDGTLTSVNGSPFTLSSEGGLLTTDPNDQFLFVLNPASNTISVLSIDSTGALTPVGSPVPAPTPPPGNGSPPSAPTCMATLADTGNNSNYLFVAYGNGPRPFTGAIVAYQIGDPTAPLTAVAITSVNAAPVGMAISPQGNIYVALQHIPGSTLDSQVAGVGIVNMNSSLAQLNLVGFANYNASEDSLVLNRDATVLFDGYGTSAAGYVESAQIPSNSAIPLLPRSQPLSAPNSPAATLLVDGSGHLLYVQQGAQAAVYIIDHTTGALSLSSTFTAPESFDIKYGKIIAHPVEQYLYTLQSAQIHVYEITDFTSGALRELSDPPYTVAGASGTAGLTLTHNAALQTATPIAAQLVPKIINFVDTTVGVSASDNSALLTNTGTQPLSVTISITGADQGDFHFDPTSCPSQLAAGSSCSIAVTFTPTQAGARQATLVVADAAGMHSIELTGNGVAAQPVANLSASAINFPTTTADGMSASQSIVLTNSGNAILHISSIVVAGQNPADFSITNSPSPSALPAACTASSYAPNASCSITVVFAPLSAGARSASIIIADDAAGSTQTVQLAGTGLDAGTVGTGNPPPPPSAIALSATSLLFTSTAVNSTTTEQYVILSNSGPNGSSLSIASVRLAGPNLSDFNLANGCTDSGYPPNQSCTLSVTFTPSALGTRFASLVITDNAPSSPQTIKLTGVTHSASETVTITAPNGFTQSVSAGGIATYALNLLSTVSGTVSFSGCSGAPSTATCTVQPASIIVSANQSVTFQVSVATAAAASSIAFDKLRHRDYGFFSIVRLCVAMTCTLLFSFFDKFCERRYRSFTERSPLHFRMAISAHVAIIALLALSVVNLAGCGGASTVATAPAVTPTSQSQTYTITITPTATTSNGAPLANVPPIQLTLIVN